MTLPLSKTLDPADYADLVDELKVVDLHFRSAQPQHEARRWEYAMALRAFDTWAQVDYEHYGHANRTHGGPIYDVGGAGSPFYLMAGPEQVRVIDPEENQRLDQFIRYARLGSAVFCLSVLEHVEDLDEFLYHLSCLVAPGGLLFLTTDCCGCALPHGDHDTDPHHFHWMRKRIFTVREGGWFPSWPVHVPEQLLDYGFSWLGSRDLTYNGAHVFDYSFASLALVKRT